ncbi:unnamed protein product [Gordionus sp. m RMFG-2023]
MGVSFIFQYNLNGDSSKEGMEFIHNSLIKAGAILYNLFSIECEIYHSIANPSHTKIIYNFALSDFANTTFSIVESSNNINLLLADKSYELFFSKLTYHGFSKKLPKIECKGSSYKIKDILVKPGIVTFGTNFKGILIQIDYFPSSIPSSCLNLVKEFITEILGNNNISPLPLYLNNRMNDLFTPSDIVHQYLEYFNLFKKNV